MRSVGELLELEKWVAGEQPKPRKASHLGHQGWNIGLEVADPDAGSFTVIVRVNQVLHESFTVGLRYQERGSQALMLLRVNGDHGGHGNPDGSRIESGPHLHAPTAAERLLPPPVRDWSTGPPTALPLAVEHNNLLVAWNRLIAEGNIRPSEAISKFMSGVQGRLAQLVAEGLFS